MVQTYQGGGGGVAYTYTRRKIVYPDWFNHCCI